MSTDDSSVPLDVETYKKLLASAEVEISTLRDKVGHCATTILETIMSSESQEEEIRFLKSRISELEAIIAASEEQSKQAEQIFTAMRGAMGRMQDTIKRVADTAKKSAAAAELGDQLTELEEAAKLPDEEDLIRPPFARN